MPTPLEQLQQVRDQILDQLASLTAETKPSYTVDGQTFHWNEYRSRLLSDLEKVEQQIAALDPWEGHTQAGGD